MAELGVIASVLQIADMGLRLSIKLYTFGEVVASTDKSVISISKDVSLTSSVLKELGAILHKDGDSTFLTTTAIKTTDDVVKECLEVFQEMENIIVKKLPNLRAPGLEKASKATILLERLRWPYLQPKLQFLQSNLDKLKSTVLLMLNVITYARQVSMKTEPDYIIADQRSLIEDLAQSNQDYIKRFENLRLGIKAQSIQSETSENNLRAQSTANFQSNVHLSAQETNNLNEPGVSVKPQNLFEAYTESAKDPRFTQLQHYPSMLTAISKEIDQVKYCIGPSSRSRVRVAVHNTFDQEMHFLAHPFGDDWLKLVRDHFAPLVAASRDNLDPYTRPQQTVHSNLPFEAVGETPHVSLLEPTSLNYRPSLSLEKEANLDNAVNMSYQSYSGAPLRLSPCMPSLSRSQDTHFARTNYFKPPRPASYYGSSTTVSPYETSDAAGYGGGGRSSLYAPPSKEAIRVVERPDRPRCWDHGCNGRQFSTFSALLKHQREKSRHLTFSPLCGARFTRETARDGHLAHNKCKNRPMAVSEKVKNPHHDDLEQPAQAQVAPIPAIKQLKVTSKTDEEQKESPTAKQLETLPKSTQPQARDPQSDLVESTISENFSRQQSHRLNDVAIAQQLHRLLQQQQPKQQHHHQQQQMSRQRTPPDSDIWRPSHYSIHQEHAVRQTATKGTIARHQTQPKFSRSDSFLLPTDFEPTRERMEQPPLKRKKTRHAAAANLGPPLQPYFSRMESSLAKRPGPEKSPVEHGREASGSIVDDLVALWTLSST